MEILGEYLRWPRSDLGSGFHPGWGSFHKLPGPSRGPRSKGPAPLPSVSGPSGGLIRRCSFTHPPGGGVTCVVGDHSWRPPEGAPHVTPPRGRVTWELETHPPPGSGRGSCHQSQGGFPHTTGAQTTCNASSRRRRPAVWHARRWQTGAAAETSSPAAKCSTTCGRARRLRPTRR